LENISFIILTIFIILLIIAIIFAIRFPPLSIAIGIATYGVKQITQYSVELFSSYAEYSYVFNIVIGGMIILSFVVASLRHEAGFCQTREGKTLLALLYIYIGLFWLSSFWSPFSDNEDNLRMLPYFVTYVILMPALASTPLRTVRAFFVLWGLLLVGCVGILLSPESLGSAYRAMIVVQSMRGKEALSPLALADMGIFLMLTSLLVIVGYDEIFKGTKIEKAMKVWKPFIKVCGFIGVALGLSIAFHSGRGEFFAGIIAAIIMLISLYVRNLRRLIFLSITSLILLLVILQLGYAYFRNDISELNDRYSMREMAQGADTRLGLMKDSLNEAFSSGRTIVFGIGARGCEQLFKEYPHSNLVQALAETGLVGFSLLIGCYLLAFHFSLRTLLIAKHYKNGDGILLICFMIALLMYSLIVYNKKSSLAYSDTYMWIALTAFVVDRVNISLCSGNYSPSLLLGRTATSFAQSLPRLPQF
jgi:hypothetical protein